MSLIIQPNIAALAPGTTATITVSPGLGFAGTAAGVVAVTNNAAVATIAGGGAAFPLTFTVSAPLTAIGSATISFNSTDSTNTQDSGLGLAVAVIPQNGYVPQGRSSVQLIATVRRRTNLNFGFPSDADILAMLNDGLEAVATRIEPIIALASLPIVTPGTNIIAFPEDVERIRDINYSTGNPALPGTVVYEMVQMDYDIFLQNTESTPAGGLGGIPTIYSIIQDFGGLSGPGAQLVQFYPFANSGNLNLHYYKRPTLLTLPQTGVSYTDLDSIYQEAVILYACMQACENREDMGTSAKYFKGMFDTELEASNMIARRRARKPGAAVVRDVSEGASVIPVWLR